MADRRRACCLYCGRHRRDAGAISWSGLCVDCAKQAVTTNVEGLMLRRKAELDRWRRGMAASIGAVLPDSPTDEPEATE